MAHTINCKIINDYCVELRSKTHQFIGSIQVYLYNRYIARFARYDMDIIIRIL